MRTKLLVLTLVPLFAGCKLDMLGPGSLDWGGGWGGGGWPVPTPELEVAGEVLIGDYPAEAEEATVYFYEPSDTVTPVSYAVVQSDGRYHWTWWDARDIPDVCDWLGRAELWSGETGALKALFDPTTNPCEGDPYRTAASLRVEYEPLATPFVLSGRVLVDDEPAQLELAVPTRFSNVTAPGTMMTTVSDEDGNYQFSTTEARQRFTWCQWAYVAATGPGGVELINYLGEVHDLQTCMEGRTFPDLRFGAAKAISGHVEVAFGPNVYRPAGGGEAEVTLLDATGSTVVLGPVETLDDGTFHMWWPAAEGAQGCEFLLDVELDDERSVLVPMLTEGQQCQVDLQRWVYVD